MLAETLVLAFANFSGGGYTHRVALAQSVTADAASETAVAGGRGRGFRVTEGIVRQGNGGTTLFHSFDQFSPATSDVIFDLRGSENLVDTHAVDLILNRVIGGDSSFIDGDLSVLRDSGTPAPDLFIINPSGITFGENAELSLPGSFLASTANSFLFGDDGSFSAQNAEQPPLLTVSRPLGLQFSVGSVGEISLQGVGHAVTAAHPIFAEHSSTESSAGLSVVGGETLALIGDGVVASDAVVQAAGGRVEVAAVGGGRVELDWLDQGFSVDYDEVEVFADVDLQRRSLIDTGGVAVGTSQVYGRQVALSDGAMILSQNRGTAAPGKVVVHASEQLTVSGATPFVDATSGIRTESFSSGQAGDIEIVTGRLVVRDGASVTSRAFETGYGGEVRVRADEALISGAVPVAPIVFSAIATATAGPGRAGDVRTNIDHLSITSGGYLGSGTFDSGNTGDVYVVADTVAVSGASAANLPSLIATSMTGQNASSGRIELSARTLTLQESGLISTTSLGIGNAGDIEITVVEKIEIAGGLPGLPTSTIASTVDFPPAIYQQLLGLTDTPQGNAGNVTIVTPLLQLNDESTVTVANLSAGNAGDLTIRADRVALSRSAIDAFTRNGEGGNIEINAADILLLNGSSKLSTTALGNSGNGGNLTINSPIVVGIENSDILANAVTGNGGNIDITTQLLLGLTFREARTLESDITASSEFGLSGLFSVNGLSLDVNSGLVVLSAAVQDERSMVATHCSVGSASSGNQFVVSGRGGVPAQPIDGLVAARLWTDFRYPGTERTSVDGRLSQLTDETQISEIHAGALMEAGGWQRSVNGEVVLRVEDSRQVSTVPDCMGQQDDV